MFDDVNEILIDGKTVLLYPHQIKIVYDSDHKATVLNSYFKGSFWLIEVKFQEKSIYIKHHTSILANKNIVVNFLY